MSKLYQDFVGLNTFIYEPNGGDISKEGYTYPLVGEEALSNQNIPDGYYWPTNIVRLSRNTIGIDSSLYYGVLYNSNAHTLDRYKNSSFSHELPNTASFFNALMSHRGNVYGYPSWRQIRVSNNPLTRFQRRNNIFTYTAPSTEDNSIINVFKEPVVSENKPLSLIGEVAVYNENLGIFENKAVQIETSFNNETVFFANQKVNEYFNTIMETDENYEALKEMYLDGGLDDEGSLLDSFSLLTYKQTVWPKQQYSYLNQTRSRTFYINKFWRDSRSDRTVEDVVGIFGTEIPSQSMWPLDSREDFASRVAPSPTYPVGYTKYEFDIGGFNGDNSYGAPGSLLNRYSTFALGGFFDNADGKPSLVNNVSPVTSYDIGENLTASVEYSRLHTLKNLFSGINPSGPYLRSSEMTDDRDLSSPLWPSNTTSSIFNGHANWDAPSQSGKRPFYDSYQEFSEELRTAGKDCSIVPEFRISNHVQKYDSIGVSQELRSIFELSGSLSEDTTTENSNSFYKIISNTDFLKHFDLIKKDHKDFAEEKIITLKCKALKKFLPYEGFYPAERTLEIAGQFSSSYGSNIDTYISSSTLTVTNAESFRIKPLLTPIAAPGILFNTIKSGVAVDFPMIFQSDLIRDADLDLNTFVFCDDLGRLTDGLYDNGAGSYSVSDLNSCLISHTRRSTINNYTSIFSKRIPFEALVEPENYLANEEMVLQEPHPFGLSDLEIRSIWDGGGDSLYKKMVSNFLAEVPEFFISDENFKTITSLEEQNPQFGNAVSGTYYLMRVKMSKTRKRQNKTLGGYSGFQVTPPQDVVSQGIDVEGLNTSGDFAAGRAKTIREDITMYSRPSAFGPPTVGDGGTVRQNGYQFWMGSTWGYNFPYTPPYYHGESWCDLIFYAEETKKYTLDEIISQAKEYPYFTRYWNPSFHDAIRDLTGYSGSDSIDPRSDYYEYRSSPWSSLITGSLSRANTIQTSSTAVTDLYYDWPEWQDMWDSSRNFYWKSPNVADSAWSLDEDVFWKSYGPQSPIFLNYNAMQLDSSVNLFGKGTVKKIFDKETGASTEVASSDTVRGKTRWIIQPKFETPILNFNKYDDLTDNNLTEPRFAKSQLPRGMWHQYGEIPENDKGIFLQIEDVPKYWLRGALGVRRDSPRVQSLADLVGFSKDPVRLGEVAQQKEISECVVAVPFIEKDATRKFFSIPREDIDSCIESSKREIAGQFIAGQPPKAGDTVYEMVKKMQKYVFPPSMDFVKYEEIEPFAMYIFEFKHNLSKQDLADIWQNLAPEIGTKMEEAEASISHELLAHELLGGGAVVKNGVLDENAEGKGIPSNIQWMVFKVKKRAKTNYFDKIVAKKGTTEDTSEVQLEGVTSAVAGKKDKDITYNWPYDFFSLVELVKIDAEVTFANTENDDKGQKSIKKVESKKTRDPSMISKARGKGRI